MTTKEGKILWVDDEVELLGAHIRLLEKKGYEVETATNGADALEKFGAGGYDIVFLDENMPGMSGIECLDKMKKADDAIPVVMITKSEEEDIMDQAIGSKIADYLIKPVNPQQIILTLKKNLHKRSIVSEQTTKDYQAEFRDLGMRINDAKTWEEWVDVYKRIVYWEMNLTDADKAMGELLNAQKTEAENEYGKFVKKHYMAWFDGTEERPVMSMDLVKRKIFPLLDEGRKVLMIVIDNFRFDQWRQVRPLVAEYYATEREEVYCAMLPAATQYARNAIFSGLTPKQTKELFPQYWADEEGEDQKNQYEAELLKTQIERFRRKDTAGYHKVLDTKQGEKVCQTLAKGWTEDLQVVVYNFVDMMSHQKTESKMIQELANTEAAYRTLTEQWMRHSALYELLKEAAKMDITVVITTDHGTVETENPVKVIGDKKSTNVNLRYKVGRMLSYNPKEVFAVTEPEKIGLHQPNITSTYIFALGHDYLVYPNNYNQYVNYYRNTLQHGGVSMEEMMIPFVVLRPKGIG